jgi:hypothetical protein
LFQPNNVFRQLVTLARDPTVGEAVKNNQVVATQNFTAIEDILEQLLVPLSCALVQGNASLLMNQSPGFRRFHPAAKDMDQHRRQSLPPSPDQPPTCKQKTQSVQERTPSPSTATERGFLTWTGAGNPPNIQTLFKLGNKNERLCQHFACKGFRCTNGRTCPQHHVDGIMKVPENQRKQIIEKIKKTQGYSFVVGCEPPGMP